MFATSLALLAAAFTGRERGTALGIWGATTGASVAVGPLVGGVLVEHVSWQSIFFVNLPIGIAAIAVTLRMVERVHGPRPGPIDWPGLVTFSAGLFALVFALVRGNAEGWGSAQIVALLVGAVALLVAFVVDRARLAHPMLDLTLFRKPTFVGASIVAFALSASMFAMFLYLTLYMQNILGFGPLEAGLRFLPITVLSFFARARSRATSPSASRSRSCSAAGLGLRRRRAAADDRAGRGLRVDRAAARLPARRRRRRPDQPGDRLDRGRRRRAAPRRHGLGRQLHLPPGRDRDRHRRPRRDLPVDDHRNDPRRAARQRRRARRRPPAAGRGRSPRATRAPCPARCTTRSSPAGPAR